MAQFTDDTVGNVLGERATFNYQTDAGVLYNMTQDSTVASAVGNDESTNANLPTIQVSAKRPIKPRYVILEGVDNPEIRKRVVIGAADNALMLGTTNTVALNGINLRVATIRGEGRTKLKVAPPA